jgi:uncharacterized membrane protein
MVTAAKKLSQLVVHMGVAFAIGYALTDSVVFSGVAVILEPVINVLLLPLHQRAWAGRRSKAASAQQRYAVIAAEKLSQTAMHMVVAFTVIFGVSGSVAFGGIAALLEPICNVLLLPLHDKLWDRVEARQMAPQQLVSA